MFVIDGLSEFEKSEVKEISLAQRLRVYNLRIVDKTYYFEDDFLTKNYHNMRIKHTKNSVFATFGVVYLQTFSDSSYVLLAENQDFPV